MQTQLKFTPRLEALEERATPASLFTAFGVGSGLVQVLRPDGSPLARFAAFASGEAGAGSVRAAVGELDGNPNTLEVAAVAGPGGPPQVRVFRVALGGAALLTAFNAFDGGFNGGLSVTTGNIAGVPGRQQVIVGTLTGSSHVRAFDVGTGTPVGVAGPLGNFIAFGPVFNGGVRVAAGNFDGNRADGDELAVAAGPRGGPRVIILRADGALLASYFAFNPAFSGGVELFADAGAGSGGDRLRAVAGSLTTGSGFGAAGSTFGSNNLGAGANTGTVINSGAPGVSFNGPNVSSGVNGVSFNGPNATFSGPTISSGVGGVSFNGPNVSSGAGGVSFNGPNVSSGSTLSGAQFAATGVPAGAGGAASRTSANFGDPGPGVPVPPLLAGPFGGFFGLLPTLF